jgi:hypothetical protein
MPFKPVETFQTGIYSLILLQNYAKKIQFFSKFRFTSLKPLETIQTPDYTLIILKKGKTPKKNSSRFQNFFQHFQNPIQTLRRTCLGDCSYKLSKIR